MLVELLLLLLLTNPNRLALTVSLRIRQNTDYVSPHATEGIPYGKVEEFPSFECVGGGAD